jgi:hypothetical protein
MAAATVPSAREPSVGPAGGFWVAAPLAAVATVFLARALPVRFPPPPNPQGIVSWATRNGYAPAQETFWYALSLAFASAVAWLLSRLLAGALRSTRARVACEGAAALSLVAMVFVPAALVAGFSVVCVLVIREVARRELAPAAPETDTVECWERRGSVALALAAVGLAAALSPDLWRALADLRRGVPDAEFASNSWLFQAEWGQFLVWADALRAGQVPGRDFYTLYGPLYPLGLVATWSLTGRSVAGWQLYYAALCALAVLAAIALAATLVRRRPLALALPLLVPVVAGYGEGLELRYGLALAGLACLARGLARGSAAWLATAGAAAGIGLLFSQEHAIAFGIAAGSALALRGRAREAGAFVAGVAAGATPCVAWLAATGALRPMLRDLAGYPALVLAGFGKLPFPSAVAGFPIPLGDFAGEPAVLLRLSYATPLVLWAALLWSVRPDRLELRRPVASLRALRAGLAADPRRLTLAGVALFGLIAFRYALGRSSLQNTFRTCGASAVLLLVAADGALDLVRRSRALGAFRLGGVAAVALLGGFAGVAVPHATAALAETLRIAVAGAPASPPPSGNAATRQVTAWVREHAGPGDEVLFLPNEGGRYYLAGRLPPTRFVLGHQMVTDAHRSEALDRLRAAPPRFLVFSLSAGIIDGIPHEEYLGSAFMRWILETYVPTERIGSVQVFERKAPPPAAGAR